MTNPLSLTGKQWNLKTTAAVSGTDLVSALARERGLFDAPDLSDPLLFPEMQKAVERIHHAQRTDEPIGIFGDYDADGITGVAQLVRYFRRHGSEPKVLLPHRERDGYGLQKKQVDEFAAAGVKLLITVDTGINAVAPVAYATEKGIDTIVTDHHTVTHGRPDAFAVLHPTLGNFPNPNLCGSGVAFTLVRGLEGGNIYKGIDEDIVLAGIGTIGDLVPLRGENRTLVMHALKLAKKLPAGPLKNFFDSVKGKTPRELSSSDIAFRIVPRINASGRMDDPMHALIALTDGGVSLERIHTLNTDRQELTKGMRELARTIADSGRSFTFVCHKDLSPGIVGLIASSLTEEFGRPSLVAAIRDGVCTASLRSIKTFNVVQALAHPTVAPLLLSFGGHAQAAGCTFALSMAARVSDALNALALESGIHPDKSVPMLELEAQLQAGDITLEFAKSLQQLEPFGQHNEEPLFMIPSQMLSNFRTVGTDAKHLQCTVGSTKAIGFRLAPFLAQLNRPCDIACRININNWNGREDVQLLIEDIR